MTHRIGRPPYPDVLTPAEWRVLEHVRDGQPNAEIAVRLGISVNTVRTHVSHMLAKLELPDRQALGAWDGTPRRRFGWLPGLPLPSFGTGALRLGILGRGAAIVGGAAAAVVLVVALATSGGGAEARTSIVARLWTGSDREDMRTQIFGIDPATGAPLVGAESIDLAGRQQLIPLGGGTSLLSPIVRTSDVSASGEPPVLTVFDGAPLGLASSGLKADADGVVRRWTLPESEDWSVVVLQPLDTPADEDVIYGYRVLPTPPDELWAFDLTSDRASLLTTATQIGGLHLTRDGRLFVLVREPGYDMSIDNIAQLGDLATAEADYLAAADDYLAEIDPVDGHEISRIQLGGAVARTMLSPDQTRLYLFRATDGDVTVVDLDTMLVEQVALPEGGPWPGVWVFGPAVTPLPSADGRFVYLTGTNFLPCPTIEEGTMSCLRGALGLRIVDLETSEVRYEDPDVDRLALSPDGRWLITALSEFQTSSGRRGDGLKIIDTATLEVIAHLEPDSAFSQVAISADNRYADAFADLAGPSNPPPDCRRPCSVITVIDLKQLEVIATHTYEGSVQALHRVP